MEQNAPAQPAGEMPPLQDYDPSIASKAISELAALPKELADLVQDLSESQLDTLYRNWTIRQITHHLADSHINSYIRFRWALTEDSPLIKAYDESRWAELSDCRSGAVEASLVLIDGLHARWCELLRGMNEDDFARTFHHPETSREVSLWTATQEYVWHGRHHTAQISWLISKHGWRPSR